MCVHRFATTTVGATLCRALFCLGWQLKQTCWHVNWSHTDCFTVCIGDNHRMPTSTTKNFLQFNRRCLFSTPVCILGMYTRAAVQRVNRSCPPKANFGKFSLYSCSFMFIFTGVLISSSCHLIFLLRVLCRAYACCTQFVGFFLPTCNAIMLVIL